MTRLIPKIITICKLFFFFSIPLANYLELLVDEHPSTFTFSLCISHKADHYISIGEAMSSMWECKIYFCMNLLWLDCCVNLWSTCLCSASIYKVDSAALYSWKYQEFS